MENEKLLENIFGIEVDFLHNIILSNPSAMGYLQGAISEEILKKQLLGLGFEVIRIKEKPPGGFDSKIDNYKGDFLIKKPTDDSWLVVESKGLKTNSEFRGTNKESEKNRKSIINKIAGIISKDNQTIYNKGYRTYLIAKSNWEENNPGKVFPSFDWSLDHPGPDSVELNDYFSIKKEIQDYFDSISDDMFDERAFRNKSAAYYILETHKPNTRIDPSTNIKQAAPLKSDFSILAVDLFQKLGKHVFVFADSNLLSHSPTSPNHLYQNYLIDILIPGIKSDIVINKPWFLDIGDLLVNSNPRRVEFDESQVDYRGDDE